MPKIPTQPPAYADTSFLFSLYVYDVNTAAAGAYVRAHPAPLAFTDWQACELRNAVRLAVARRTCTAVAAAAALAKISAHAAGGSLAAVPLVWPDVLQFAEQLSAQHTATLAVRTLDILHVAAAASAGTKVFLTFDGRQKVLAQAVGLQVQP